MLKLHRFCKCHCHGSPLPVRPSWTSSLLLGRILHFYLNTNDNLCLDVGGCGLQSVFLHKIRLEFDRLPGNTLPTGNFELTVVHYKYAGLLPECSISAHQSYYQFLDRA